MDQNQPGYVNPNDVGLELQQVQMPQMMPMMQMPMQQPFMDPNNNNVYYQQNQQYPAAMPYYPQQQQQFVPGQQYIMVPVPVMMAPAMVIDANNNNNNQQPLLPSPSVSPPSSSSSHHSLYEPYPEGNNQNNNPEGQPNSNASENKQTEVKNENELWYDEQIKKDCGVKSLDPYLNYIGSRSLYSGPLILIFALVSVAYACYAYNITIVPDEVIKSSWTSLPVTDIQFSSSTCPYGYESVDGMFPGLENNLAVPAVKVQMNRNHVLCVSRGGVNAVDRPEYTNNKCPSGYQVCGTVDVKQFCSPSTSLCPITDLLSSSIPLSFNDPTIIGSTVGSVVNGSSIYLYFKRGGLFNNSFNSNRVTPLDSYGMNGNPLVDFVFAPSHPCAFGGCGYTGRSNEFLMYENSYLINHPQSTGYKLNYKCTGCSASDINPQLSSDKRFFKFLEGPNEGKLYSSYNDRIPQEFIPPSNSPYNWYYSARPEILYTKNENCTFSQSDVYNHLSIPWNIHQASYATKVMSIIGTFCSNTIAAFMVMYADSHKSYKEFKEIFQMGMVMGIMYGVPRLGCLISTAYIHVKLRHFRDILNTVVDNHCVDPISALSFSTSMPSVNQFIHHNNVVLAMEVLFCICFLIVYSGFTRKPAPLNR